MKVVIAGSRTLHHKHAYFHRALEKMVVRFEEEYGPITMVVSGLATGPDKIGYALAKDHGVHVAEFPAKWDINGRAAGIIRNTEMAKFADGAIIMHDGESAGTKHMINEMRKLKKPFILDIFEPIDYNYEHLPSGKIKWNRM